MAINPTIRRLGCERGRKPRTQGSCACLLCLLGGCDEIREQVEATAPKSWLGVEACGTRSPVVDASAHGARHWQPVQRAGDGETALIVCSMPRAAWCFHDGHAMPMRWLDVVCSGALRRWFCVGPGGVDATLSTTPSVQQAELQQECVCPPIKLDHGAVLVVEAHDNGASPFPPFPREPEPSSAPGCHQHMCGSVAVGLTRGKSSLVVARAPDAMPVAGSSYLTHPFPADWRALGRAAMLPPLHELVVARLVSSRPRQGGKITARATMVAPPRSRLQQGQEWMRGILAPNLRSSTALSFILALRPASNFPMHIRRCG